MNTTPTITNKDNTNSALISPPISSSKTAINPANNSLINPPIKLGIMASGSGSNFEVIAREIHQRKLNAQIQVLIYNKPQAKVKDRAKNWNIPAILLNHKEYQDREKFDAKIVEILKQNQVELVVMAGWMRIVTPVLINAFPNKIINIHPSLLPSFKGNKAVENALEAGVKITGCTVHLVVPEVDSGEILIQAAVPILPNDNLETLHARIQVQEHKILPEAIVLAAKLDRK